MLKVANCPAVALAVLGVGMGLAQPTPPKGFSGSIVSVSGDTVTLADKDGKAITVAMTPGWTVSVNRAGTAADIRVGDFIATTNVPVGDGSGRSTGVRILEPGYEPEHGTHAVSPNNPNMMTHARVASVARTADGVELEVGWPGGSRTIVVPSSVPVTVSDPLDKSVLKAGAMVGGVTRVGADGVARASRLQLTKP